MYFCSCLPANMRALERDKETELRKRETDKDKQTETQRKIQRYSQLSERLILIGQKLFSKMSAS